MPDFQLAGAKAEEGASRSTLRRYRNLVTRLPALVIFGYAVGMTKRAHSKDEERRPKPSSSDAKREAGYDEWLASEIEAGRAELDAGKRISAKEVWKKLGLE